MAVVCRVILVLKLIGSCFVPGEYPGAVSIPFYPFPFGDPEHIFKDKHILADEALTCLVGVFNIECTSGIKLHYLFICKAAQRITFPAGKLFSHIGGAPERLVMHDDQYTVL